MQVLATEEETVGAYLSSWLQHAKTRVRTKTYEGYETLVRLYARPGIGDLPLAAVTPLVLQRLYADLLTDPERHLSGGRVLNLHLVLSQAFSQGPVAPSLAPVRKSRVPGDLARLGVAG